MPKHSSNQRTKAQINRPFTLKNSATSQTVSTSSGQASHAQSSTIPPRIAVQQNPVVGNPGVPAAPGLRPVARVQIMSDIATTTIYGPTGILASTNVADPTGNATDARPVYGWNNRFGGFQQYRIVSTRWIITPIRQLVGTTTSSQCPGHVGIWIMDSPQTGAPNSTQFRESNCLHLLVNTDRIEKVTYTTNEPQDLNLTDISSAPSHVIAGTVTLGQHCLQIYGDTTYTGIGNVPATGYTPLFTVRAVYDIEFFGVGGV